MAEEAQVGGDDVARLETDQITGNEFVDRDDLGLAVSGDMGSGGGVAFESFEGLFGTVFLEETQDGVDEDEDKNHDTVKPFT